MKQKKIVSAESAVNESESAARAYVEKLIMDRHFCAEDLADAALLAMKLYRFGVLEGCKLMKRAPLSIQYPERKVGPFNSGE